MEVKQVKDLVSHFMKKNALFVSPALFIWGFVVDLFTLNRIDQTFDLCILLFHLSLTTVWLSWWQWAIVYEGRGALFSGGGVFLFVVFGDDFFSAVDFERYQP